MFVLPLAETERRLLTRTAMTGTFFLMTAVSFVLLKLTLIVILQSIQLNVTFVETIEGCLQKYVMTGTSLMELDVHQIVYQYFQLGLVQGEIVLKTMCVFQSMETGLLRGMSNATTTILLTMTAALLQA